MTEEFYREERSLLVLWKSKGRQDVLVPLPGVEQVQVIRIDGRRRTLSAGGKGITLSVSEDPLLLLYDGGDKTLPPALGAPAAALLEAPAVLGRRASATLAVGGSGVAADDLELMAPPRWTVTKAAGTPGSGSPSVRFTLTPPEVSSVREADLLVTITVKGKRVGELYHRLPIAEDEKRRP